MTHEEKSYHWDCKEPLYSKGYHGDLLVPFKTARRTVIVLEKDGERFELEDVRKKHNDIEGIEYMWTEGNYSCDCNRELFIKRQQGEDAPDRECGETYELISMTFYE